MISKTQYNGKVPPHPFKKNVKLTEHRKLTLNEVYFLDIIFNPFTANLSVLCMFSFFPFPFILAQEGC